MGVFGTTTDTEGGSWRAHINRSHGRLGRPGPASRYSAGPALVRSPALGIPDRCAGHSEVGNGILLPTKKAGHHSPAFFVPTAATTSPDQRPPPISTPPQLCSAERIAEPTNALLSRHTSCILRPTRGEDARHHLPRSPRYAQPGHPSAPETGPPPTTTPPHQAPARPHGRAQGPVWSPHPERVNPSPVKG